MKFENRSRATRSRFHKSFAFLFKLRETSEGTSCEMVRFVFRHFATASTRVSPDFALLRLFSRFSACKHTCSYSYHTQDNGRLLLHVWVYVHVCVVVMLLCCCCVVWLLLCCCVVVCRGVCLVCVCLCVLRHAEKSGKNPYLASQTPSMCAFETSPCMPAPRAHVLKHVRVVPVHTVTF